MLVAHHRRSGMQMTPAVELRAAEDAADGGGAEAGGLGNLVSGTQLATKRDHLRHEQRRGSARAMQWPRRTITQAGQPQGAIATEPLTGSFPADAEPGCSRVQRHLLDHDFFG